MALSRKVFLDYSVFLSFVDRAAPKHEAAGAFLRYFAINNYLLYTDTASMMKAYEKMYSDISPTLAKDFLRTIYLSDINILYPEESEAKAALKALINYRSTELTYSQALMAVLSIKRGISQICSFDYIPALFGIELFYLPL